MTTKPIRFAVVLLACQLLAFDNLTAEQFGLFTYRIINGVEAEITGYPPFEVGSVEIPAVINGMPVTSIGDMAFYLCEGLTAITMPASITNIGSYAFHRCAGLTAVTVPENATRIGTGAFSRCYGLASVTLPTGLITIADGVFMECPALPMIDIPPNVNRIGAGAFEYCSSLVSVAIPGSATSIGDMAFFNCANLSNAQFGHGVTALGASAFQVCGNLRSVAFPATLSSISVDAFRGCRSLTGVTLPAGLGAIGAGAFLSCENLAGAAFLGPAPVLGNAAFAGAAPGFTVHYLNGSAGFSSPTWNSYPAVGTAGAPGVSAAVVPPDGNTGSGVLPRLAWLAVPAGGFEVHLGTAPGSMERIASCNGQTFELPVPEFLEPSTTYHWRVDRTAGGATTQGTVFTFTTRPALVVDTLLDENDSGLGQGAGNSLRECLAAAAVAVGADAIRFAPALNGGTITLGGSELVVHSDVSIDAPQFASPPAISANRVSRVMRIESGCDVQLSNLILKDGYVFAPAAGVLNAGSLRLVNCEVTGNHASGPSPDSGNGAGMYNARTGIVRIEGGRFTDNLAGGAGARGAGISNDGKLTVRAAGFYRNIVGISFNGGGAIFNSGELLVDACQFVENSGGSIFGYGGGIQNLGTATVTNSRFERNDAETGGGMSNSGTTEVRACVFHDNRGWIRIGGGFSNFGVATVRDSSFSRNSAERFGGGVGNYGILTLVNCTLEDNGCGGWGGGIYTDQGWSGTITGALRLVNCTICNNVAGNLGGGTGAGVCKPSGTLHVENSIVARNTLGPASLPDDIDGAIDTTAGYNLIGGEPLLAQLGNYGGPTPTMPPLPGSPAIDAGVATSDTPAADQRGVARPVDGNGDGVASLDIGAVELVCVTVTTLVDENDGDTQSIAALVASPGGTGISLREAIVTTNHSDEKTRIDFASVLAGRQIDLAGGQLLFERDMWIDASELSLPVRVSAHRNSRVMSIAEGVNVVIAGVHIKDGAVSRSPVDGGGGGILNWGTLRLSGARISGCSAFMIGGGGLVNLGVLEAEDSVIEGNWTSGGSGGGIYNWGSAELTRCKVLDNTASDPLSGRGGGIYNDGAVSLTDCTVADCWAHGGGGIAGSYLGTVKLTRCTLARNIADLNDGSGAGGISSSGDLEVLNCTFYGNHAALGNGGAIALGGGQARIVHSTISGNVVGREAYHFPRYGAGIFKGSGTLHLENSIVAGNYEHSSGLPEDVSGGIDSVGGRNLIGGDPMLASLGRYGGPTETMPPLPGSPAVDAAISTADSPSVDQRGLPRYWDGEIDPGNPGNQSDIGAVELTRLTVTTTADELDGDTSSPGALAAAPGGSGLSLREAIDASNRSGGGLFVDFAPALAGRTISLLSGELVLGEDVVVDASGLPGGVTVSGNLTSRVFKVPAGVSATLVRLTVTQGRPKWIDLDDSGWGGGVWNRGKLCLVEATVTGNQAGGLGGSGHGIYNEGELEIRASQIVDNHAADWLAPGYGGGIYNTATLRIHDSLIARNLAGRGSGGGIWNGVDGRVELTGSSIEENFSEGNAGGIWNEGELVMEACGVGENVTSTAFGSFGGGLVNWSAGTVRMIDCVVRGNRCGSVAGYPSSGAGICNDGEMTMANTTVGGNQVVFGGGGGISNGGNLTIRNSTIAGNETMIFPGTVSGPAGGISNGGVLVLENSIVAGNSADPSAPDIAGAITTERGRNLISNISGITPPPVGAVIVAPARLAPLGDHGGPTWTMPPLPGSLAIDNGIATADSPIVDQRGVARPQGTAIDIGAVEIMAGDHAVVTATAPGNGEAQAGLRPLLEWQGPSVRPDSLRVWFGTVGGEWVQIGTPAGGAAQFELPGYLIPGGSYRWRVDSVYGSTVSTGAEFTLGSGDFLPPRALYAAWAAGHGLTGGNGLPEGEPFGDGVSNLIKYACNLAGGGSEVRSLTPGTGTSGLPVLSTGQGTGGQPVFRFEFLRRRNAGLVYQPEQAAGLANGTWQPMYGTEIVTDIDADWERVIMEQSHEVGVDRRFFRLAVTLPGEVPADFATVPAGEFLMGDPFNEGAGAERPRHPVQLSAFHIGAYEVTKELWERVRNWGRAIGYPDLPAGQAVSLDRPIGWINWHDALKWCNARSHMEGLTPCYTVAGLPYLAGTDNAVVCDWMANGYRLPSEAEWEKVARGGLTGKRFPWGDRISHSPIPANPEVGTANYFAAMSDPYDDSPTGGYHPLWAQGPAPVGSFPANGYGLRDMAGNAYEWCWDWWSEIYYQSSPYADPHGPVQPGTQRVIRGGSFGHSGALLRCANRGKLEPGKHGNDVVGFRVARGAVP